VNWHIDEGDIMSTAKTKKSPATGSAAGTPAMQSMPVEGDMPAGVDAPDDGHAMPGARLGVSYAGQAGAAGMAAEGAGDLPGGGMPPAPQGMGGSSCMQVGNGSGMDGGGGGTGGGGDDGQGGQGGAPQVRTCATMDVHRRLLTEDPSYANVRAEIENQAGLYEGAGNIAGRSGVTRIPVVVHVVWNTAAQNISDAQIASQIDVLNRDFRRVNPDVNSTPAPFLPLTADARVEFALATTGPNGAATSGIERRQTTVASFGADDAVKAQATGGMDAWPADSYLNIWVCQLGGGLLGYAQFPGGPAATDGVVILQSAFGTTGTPAPPFHLGRTATHEIGHWLNLNHIWGDDGTGCSGTDNVADTPNQGGPNTGQPSFPHVSCSNGPNGDMFMNYMDYVDDPAMFMFTTGQVARMQACLDGPRASIGTGGADGGAGGGVTSRQSSSPAVAWGANRLDVFVLGTDRALYHKAWNGSAWAPSVSGYEAQGGLCTSAPQVVSWGANRLDVFVTGTDSGLFHKWWNGTAWGPSLTGYESMGGLCVGDPRAVAWGPNRLDVFVVGTDRGLYHKWWNGAAWGPSLTGYEAMGGICLGQPEAVAWGPNRLDVFVIGTDHALYHKWWDGTAWGPSLTGYERLGGICTSSPKAVAWGPNRLDVFVTGTDGALYHKWWDGAKWRPSTDGFERLGGVCVGEVEAVSWAANRLDLFVIGTDSALYHKAWNGSAWSPSLTGFENLGGVCTSRPRATAWAPDRLDVFVTGTNGALFHKAWNGTAWSPSVSGYESLGGVVSCF
jgi:hypothetical protein